MASYLQIVTTAPSREVAQQIASMLVERCLAACVQVVGPITSTYRWEGRVETAEEWQCVIKTGRALWDGVEQAIRELHPYQVPEIIALPIECGSRAYLEWIDAQTASDAEHS